MGLLKNFLEGMAIALGVILMLWLLSKISILGIGDFVKGIAERIGDLFISIGQNSSA